MSLIDMRQQAMTARSVQVAQISDENGGAEYGEHEDHKADRQQAIFRTRGLHQHLSGRRIETNRWI